MPPVQQHQTQDERDSRAPLGGDAADAVGRDVLYCAHTHPDNARGQHAGAGNMHTAGFILRSAARTPVSRC